MPGNPNNSPTTDDDGALSGTLLPLNRNLDPGVLDLDSTFRVLSHPRRRYVVYALSIQPTWSLHSLAETIYTWEQDATHHPANSSGPDHIYTSLYHSQVPKLVDYDVIEFDTGTEQITRGSQAEHVMAILEAVSERLSIDYSLAGEDVTGAGENGGHE